MRKIIILIAFLIVNIGFTQSTSSFFDLSDTFFKTFIVDGRVNYKAIKKNPESLDKLLKIAATISVSKNSPKTYQAFFINAYNLAVIKGIVNKYPVKSPLDIKGFFDKTTYVLGGKKTTLNDLENLILRKNFPSEARFHFVLVCAGLGCPPIISEAYKPNLLEKQLQRQTKLALNNPDFIKVKGKKVQVSQIFEWYKVDFVRDGSEIDFINKYRTKKIPSNSKFSYYSYDWNLNILK